MKSDIIHVNSDGTGIREALSQAELVASYKRLPPKETIRLRLLAEEMMGMVEAITGALDADFWIEDDTRGFRLHLTAETAMNSAMRKEFMAASTTGRNASAKGVMGKIRELFEKALEPVDESFAGYYDTGWYATGADTGGVDLARGGVWSLNRYRDSLGHTDGDKEKWDELEKSIVANIADEIEIGIKNGTVEMVIYKRFRN